MAESSREAVRALLGRFLAQHRGEAGGAPPADEHDLFAAGDLDSVAFVELLAWLSDETGRELDLTEVDPGSLARVGSLLDHFAGDGAP
jgi:acyl carrier protein